MESVTKIREGLNFIAYILEKEMVAKLRSQGHDASGDLIKSVKNEVRHEIGKWQIIGKSVFYGTYIDRGRPAKTKRVPISALINWIVRRRLAADKKQIRAMAFAIQYNIWKNGITNPSKLGWVTDTLRDNKDYLRKEIEKLFGDTIEIGVLNIIRLTNEKLK